MSWLILLTHKNPCYRSASFELLVRKAFIMKKSLFLILCSLNFQAYAIEDMRLFCESNSAVRARSLAIVNAPDCSSASHRLANQTTLDYSGKKVSTYAFAKLWSSPLLTRNFIFSNNYIDSIKEFSSYSDQLSVIWKLDLTSNRITSLKNTYLPVSLKELYLGKNRIGSQYKDDVPPEIIHINSSLRVLDLSGNMLHKYVKKGRFMLEFDLSERNNVDKLVLSGNRLKSLDFLKNFGGNPSSLSKTTYHDLFTGNRISESACPTDSSVPDRIAQLCSEYIQGVVPAVSPKLCLKTEYPKSMV